VQLFTSNFSDKNSLSGSNLKKAIALYIRSLSSLNSPLDQYMLGMKKEIDASVYNGFNLFMGKGKCGTCHFAPLFNGLVPPRYVKMESEVIGVPSNTDTLHPQLDPDQGRFGILPVKVVRNAFKTTTVRNISLTAPYMHNGVYSTLEEVIDFYNRGGGAGLGIAPEHQTLPFDKLNLSAREKKDIIAFLHSLTDTSSIMRY
jgi:cytochrome c peroxidase